VSWIASALGLAGGVVFVYAMTKAALPRLIGGSRNALTLVRLALAGTLVALLPALFLSLALGATLGAAWGQELFAPYGLAPSGVPLGIALCVGLIFAGVVLAGTATGFAVGKALHRARS
jgi:hypothetical protein